MTSLKELRNEISNTINGLEGWCTTEKGFHISDIIIEEKCKNFVEIGVFGGKSLLPVALTFKYLGRGTAWGIDSWRNEDSLENITEMEHREWWEQKDLEEVYTNFVRTVIDKNLTAYCSWIRSKSESAVRLFEDKSLDMIHIDGNHSEEMSTLDVQLWLPKVRSKGMVLMDDTDAAEWESVQKSVRMVEKECDLIVEINGYSLFRKH